MLLVVIIFVSLLFSSDRLGLYQMGLSKTMFMTFA